MVSQGISRVGRLPCPCPGSQAVEQRSLEAWSRVSGQHKEQSQALSRRPQPDGKGKEGCIPRASTTPPVLTTGYGRGATLVPFLPGLGPLLSTSAPSSCRAGSSPSALNTVLSPFKSPSLTPTFLSSRPPPSFPSQPKLSTCLLSFPPTHCSARSKLVSAPLPITTLTGHTMACTTPRCFCSSTLIPVLSGHHPWSLTTSETLGSPHPPNPSSLISVTHPPPPPPSPASLLPP